MQCMLGRHCQKMNTDVFSSFMQVCLYICSWSWSSSRSTSNRNLSQSNQSQSHGILYVCTLGNFLLLVCNLCSVLLQISQSYIVCTPFSLTKFDKLCYTFLNFTMVELRKWRLLKFIAILYRSVISLLGYCSCVYWRNLVHNCFTQCLLHSAWWQ